MKKTILIVAVFIIIASASTIGYLHFKQQSISSTAQENQLISTNPNQIADYLSAVISALASYRQSTQEVSLIAKQYTDKGVDLNNRSVKTAEELAVVGKVVNDFKNGNAYLAQYLSDNNQLISISAQAINQSANSILKPNEDMQQAFHDGDTQKEQEALAAATVAQDQGTNDMNNVMQIIREGLIIGLGPNDKLPSSGTINTPLSIEQRNNLLSQIRNEFPNGVNNYSHDIYSLMIYGIQAAILSNTFEQFRSTASAMTTDGAPALPFVVAQN